MAKYRILFILLFAVLTLTSRAQEIPKGTYLLGGNLNFSMTKSTNKLSGINSSSGQSVSSNTMQPTDISVSASPKMGYFIVKNLAVGIQVQYDLHISSDTTSQSQLFVGPFFRYYVGVGDIVFLFIEAAPGFGVNTNSYGNNSLSASALSVGVGPGVAVFCTNDLALEVMLQYRYLNQSVTESGIKNTTTSGQFNFGLGLQFYLKGKTIGQPVN